MTIKLYHLNSQSIRVAVAAVGALAVVAAIFVAKWGFAHSAAVRSDMVEVASLAADIAPDDPQTHYVLAILSEKTFVTEDLERAVLEFEKAAALSPNNYILWLDLGRARERNGDRPGAERALRKALDLAPNYSRVQWALGNTLLRQGKNEDAFAEIRKAVAGDAAYTNSAATTAWQIFDGDIAQVRTAIGDSNRANASLATLLTGKKRFDEAFAIWETLPADEKKTSLKETGDLLYRQLIEAGKYRFASRIGEQNAATQNSSGITNGGFEEPVTVQTSNIFSWQIAEGASPRIGPTDGQKHGGNYSLLLSFGQATKSIRQIAQTIVVEPGRSYVFELYYRSDLKTQAKLKWEILSAAHGKVIAATEPLASASDWMLARSTFTVPEDIDGVTIRFVAEGCDPANCLISGNMWFDDFALKASN